MGSIIGEIKSVYILAVHFDIYVAIRRKLRNDVILVGGCILDIAAVLF